MTVPLQPIQALRLTAIIQQLVDVRTLPGELRFLNRTPIVEASDDEILARYTGYVQIADLVSDDAQAVTYSAGKFQFESTTIPNIKHGINLTQQQINQLGAIAGLPAGVDRVGVFDWLNRNTDSLLLGIRQRMNALICAMQIDGLDYDRLGIKLTNVSWGMPSDLKITVATPWTDAANATPVNDCLGFKLYARTRYGKEYNRLTMSTTAFQYMIATTEFQNKARTFLAPNVSFVNLSLSNIEQQQALAQNVLGMTIEFEDARYWSQGPDGKRTSHRYQPINKVIFSNSGDDNRADVMDFGNAITTESIVSGIVGGMVGNLGGAQRGPVSYVTAPENLNPPTLTQWAVARGFPRKLQLEATAVMTVGSFDDLIPITPPY